MEAGQGVIWNQFAPVLRGLVEKSNGFRTAMEAFRSKISGRYFVKCANVRYPPAACFRCLLERFSFVFIVELLVVGRDDRHRVPVTLS